MTQVRLLPKQPNRVSLHKLCGCGSLHKAKAAVTNVGKYVAKHEDETAKKIERVLAEQGKKIAAQVAKLYVNKMLKAEWNEEDHPRDEDGKFAGGVSSMPATNRKGEPREDGRYVRSVLPETDAATADSAEQYVKTHSGEGERRTLRLPSPSLVTLQPVLRRDTLTDFVADYDADKSNRGNPITVVRVGDQDVVTDGNHRIAAALLRGDDAIDVDFFDAGVTKLAKADSTAAIVQSILKELELTGLSVSIVESLTPELLAAFNSAGIVGVAQVGINTTAKIARQIDVAALAYVDVHGAELVKGLSLTTEDALRSEITRAMKDGSSAQELAKSIRELGAFSRSRASTIARTELATAHIQGNVQGWRETGMVSGKEWIMGDLHDIEDVCDLNAMKGQIGLDEEFEDGIMFPPAHPNCICDVLPVLADEVTN